MQFPCYTVAPDIFTYFVSVYIFLCRYLCFCSLHTFPVWVPLKIILSLVILFSYLKNVTVKTYKLPMERRLTVFLCSGNSDN